MALAWAAGCRRWWRRVDACTSASRTPSIDPQSTGTIPALDGVRGVAISAVLAYHFSVFATRVVGSNALQSLASFGYSGVDLFFVLSGFLITGRLLDARGAPGWLATFYVRRVLRIFPLYYAAVALAIAGQRALAEPGDLQTIAAVQPWLWTHALNIKIATQNHWSPYWLGHFWSLGVEEQFYLIWPATVALLSRRMLALACAAAVPAALGARLWLFSTGHVAAAFTLMPCRMDALCLGALAALAARSTAGLRSWRGASRASLAVSGVLTAAMLLPGTLWTNTVGIVRMTVVAVFCTSLVVEAVASPASGLLRRLFETRALRTLGRYSYGLYVIHHLIAPGLLATFPFSWFRGLPAAMVTLAFVMYASAVVIPVAWASWNFFESQFLKLKPTFKYATAAKPRIGRFDEVRAFSPADQRRGMQELS